MPQVEVTFDIDANGILKVTASDKATGRSQHITITASSGLNDSEVEKMRKEAEAHAEEDRRRKELIEARNMADNTISTGEKLIKDYGEKLPAEMKTQIEDGSAKLKQVIATDNTEDIRKATDELGQVIQKVGGSMYQQAGPTAGPETGAPEGGPAGPTGPASDDGNVVDGEFRNA
jgi:molecular chaperone DnaK